MYEERQSFYPFVDHYWCMTADEDGAYPQSAMVQWGLMFIQEASGISARLVGPRTNSVATPYRKGQTYWGIRLPGRVGLVDMPKEEMLNRNITLPMLDATTFRLGNHTLSVPEYEAFDAFVSSLCEQGVLTVHPIVDEAAPTRTKQRQFKQITGLTPKQIEQAERIANAIDNVVKGLPLADVAAESGFADQAHMTRAFKALVGQSPAQIRDYFA